MRKESGWGFKEVRKIDAGHLRVLCIEHNWYTNGNNEEYGHLLYDLADHKENITTDDVCEITKDIIDHSNLSEEAFENVAYEVMKIATVYLVRE